MRLRTKRNCKEVLGHGTETSRVIAVVGEQFIKSEKKIAGSREIQRETRLWKSSVLSALAAREMRCNSMPLIFLLMLNGFLLYKSGLLHVILRRHLKKIETSAKETRNVKGDLPSQNAATNAAAGDNNRIVTKHENNQRHGSKKNIIAMSLFGISPTYPVGVDRNIDLMMKFFPDWIIRVYIEKFGKLLSFNSFHRPAAFKIHHRRPSI